MKSISKTYSCNLFWTKPLRKTTSNFNRKVLKVQRYSSVTLLVSPKNAISAEKLKITFSKIQILPPKFLPDWFGPKQIEAIRF